MIFLNFFLLILLFGVVVMTLLSILSRSRGPAGMQDGTLKPCGSRSQNCVCSEATESQTGSNWVAPLQFKSDDATNDILNQIESAVETLGGEVLNRDGDYLATTFRSKLFRFTDDTEFLLNRSDNNVHVRSASRVGRKDLGVNRKRVEAIRQSLGLDQ